MNTTEKNKLIAEFMGYAISEQTEGFAQRDKYPKNPFEEISFNSSWDWLMPVVEKIHSDTDCFVTIYYKECTIHNMYSNKMKDIRSEKENTLQSIYEAVVQFVKWYNETINQNLAK